MSEDALLLAQHYIDIAQFDKALAQLERSATTHFEDAEYWRLRAHALYKLERYEDGVTAAHQGLERDPNYVWLLYTLCRIEADRGDSAAAERAILSALELEPENINFLARYGILLAEAKHLKKADKLIAYAERLDADHQYVNHARTMLEYYKGNTKEVMRRGRERLAQDPNDVAAKMFLAAGLGESRRFREAAKHANSVVSESPESKEMAEYARELRLLNHPLLLPLWPLQRFGSIAVMIFNLVLFMVFMAFGFINFAMIIIVLHFILVIYSWTMPYILRLYFKWRYG